jgi:oligoendopeptidase F
MHRLATSLQQAPPGAGSAADLVPDRADVPERDRWKLEHVFPTPEAWEEEFARVERSIAEVASLRGTLGGRVETLVEGLGRHASVAAALDRLFVYAHLLRDQDTRNPATQALAERIARLSTRLAEAAAFLEPEILSLGRARLEEFQASPAIGIWRRYLHDLLRREEHTLSPSEERILAMAGDITRIPRTVFGMLNDADLSFGSIRDEEGREVEITHVRYAIFLESPDRRVRRDAWTALFRAYESHRNTIAGLFSGAIQRDVFLARVRRHESSLHAALHGPNIPVEVYHTLLSTVDARRDVVHRAMALRRRLLGIDDLRMYDLHAPLTADAQPKVTWEEACELLVEGMAPLGADYVRALREGLEGGWVDVRETRGKRSGAYSWGAYGTHPYVLMNYQGTIDHLFTLAHEMGHALHHRLTCEHQPYPYSHAPIFLAEVASTTNEALLLDHLLRVKTDGAWQSALLSQAIDQIRGTVVTQVIFASFELEVHEMAERGEALTVPTLSTVYRRAFERILGPDLELDDRAALGWARIPHFYNSFYVYQYATGYAAAIALSRRILQGGDEERRAYLGFLEAGDSDDPIEILKRAGVDPTTPRPVLDTLDHFESLLDRLEELHSSKGAGAATRG